MTPKLREVEDPNLACADRLGHLRKHRSVFERVSALEPESDAAVRARALLRRIEQQDSPGAAMEVRADRSEGRRAALSGVLRAFP